MIPVGRISYDGHKVDQVSDQGWGRTLSSGDQVQVRGEQGQGIRSVGRGGQGIVSTGRVGKEWAAPPFAPSYTRGRSFLGSPSRILQGIGVGRAD
jgi:hypothetical protein